MKKSDYVRFGSLLVATGVPVFAQAIGGGGDDPFSILLGGVWNSVRADAPILLGIAIILVLVGILLSQRSEGMGAIGKLIFCGAGILGTTSLIAWIQGHVA